MRGMLRWLGGLIALVMLLAATPAFAHPAPFSYLDLDLKPGEIDGSLVVHIYDAGHDLGVAPDSQLFDPALLAPHAPTLIAHMDQRLELSAGRRLKLDWTGVEPLPQRNSLKLSFRIPNAQPGALTIHTELFPYDPQHQTFVNIYEGGKLHEQEIFSRDSGPHTYYRGTTSGVLEVIKTFVPAGVHHILIGPDHILFLCGLLLLGGSLKSLVKIVTCFTLGHSLTLTLATLSVLSPPASIVEPAIALTIIVVGADNLMRKPGGVDLRPWAALVFGLVHGFGFASVLREFGLPRQALGWSLFSFNVGVEIGQLLIVLIVASLLDFVAKRSQTLRAQITVVGSIVVITAGAFWFIQRVFFPGGSA